MTNDGAGPANEDDENIEAWLRTGPNYSGPLPSPSAAAPHSRHGTPVGTPKRDRRPIVAAAVLTALVAAAVLVLILWLT